MFHVRISNFTSKSTDFPFAVKGVAKIARKLGFDFAEAVVCLILVVDLPLSPT